jgi:hypothetical protein
VGISGILSRSIGSGEATRETRVGFSVTHDPHGDRRMRDIFPDSTVVPGHTAGAFPSLQINDYNQFYW